ncbi:MAG: hypothetical protein OEY64_03200 [Nitrospinota bacterium]|nr:hypothetical protein [Nitrospinota bacterium]
MDAEQVDAIAEALYKKFEERGASRAYVSASTGIPNCFFYTPKDNILIGVKRILWYMVIAAAAGVVLLLKSPREVWHILTGN